MVIDYGRQNLIFKPEDYTKKIIVIGAGSTGSYSTLMLAKMGIQNIQVIDYDKVEEHNIPNQYYRTSDIGKYKTEALKEIIKDFTDIEISTLNIKIDENFEFNIELDDIILICVDNIETRKLIINKLEMYPITLIDTRFGAEGYSIHIVDTKNIDQIIEYKKGLELPTKETLCGQKAVIYTINSLASEVTNIIKKIIKNEQIPTLLRRELKTYRFITKMYN